MLRRQTPGLVTHHPQHGLAQLTGRGEVVDRAGTTTVGAVDRQTEPPGTTDGLLESDSHRYGQVEDAAGAGPDRLGVVEVHRVRAHQDGVGPERVGAADDGTQVPRVPDLVTEHNQPGEAPERLVQPDVDRG